MKIQEQIQRIHQMMGLLNESSDKIADEILDKLIDEKNLNFLENNYLNLHSESLRTGKSDKKEEFIDSVKEKQNIINVFWEINPEEYGNYDYPEDELINKKYEIIYKYANKVLEDDFIQQTGKTNLQLNNDWKDYIDAYRLFPI